MPLTGHVWPPAGSDTLAVSRLSRGGREAPGGLSNGSSKLESLITSELNVTVPVRVSDWPGPPASGPRA